MHPNVYTPETLAQRWECSPAHVRKMCAAGTLPAFRIGTKLWRIKPQDVEAYEAPPAAQAREALSSVSVDVAVERLKTAIRAEGERR